MRSNDEQRRRYHAINRTQGAKVTTNRTWFISLVPDVRIRVSYRRAGRQIVRFTVQLEIVHDGAWTPVVRYDNAHGFCHRDAIHVDGSQDKTLTHIGDANATFTAAIDDLKRSWEAQRARFLKEIEA